MYKLIADFGQNEYLEILMGDEFPSASMMRERTFDRREIKLQIEEIMSSIKAELFEAQEKCATKIKVYLPSLFRIVGVEESIARNLIYSDIIKKLSSKGYICKINLKVEQGKKVPMEISWESSDRRQFYDENNQLLAKHTDQRLR